METATTAKVCDYDRNFNGCILGITERNGYHDSDFYATVWDEEQGCVRTIEDGTTRFYAPSKYHRADATEEVVTKARAWWANEVGPKQAYATLKGRALFIDVCSEVEVIKGRKLPLGTTGEVVWKGQDSFKRNGYRIGIRLANGTRVYTSMDNVMKLNVLEPTQEQISDWVKSNNPY
jgi:hypothetical protein